MKKIKTFTLILLVIIITLTILSFIKLPINTLTDKRIQKETNNFLKLNSFEKQSLLLLPSPNIEIINSVFTFNSDNLAADIEIPSLEIYRALFDKNNVNIKLKKASLQNIETTLINNEVLLENEIENVKINIKKLNETMEIETNDFTYKGANIYINAIINEKSLEKLSFSINQLEIDELVLLLDEKYQKYLKKINTSILKRKIFFIDLGVTMLIYLKGKIFW